MMFRGKGNSLEVLLVHPGGPFFVRKDEGAWTIPKGEAAPGEDLLKRAQIEFEEELGVRPNEDLIPLGLVKQKGGKIVHVWAVEGDRQGAPRHFPKRSRRRNPPDLEGNRSPTSAVDKKSAARRAG
jgi:predicted NUDIX family NTP pyrophosphohydrolase